MSKQKKTTAPYGFTLANDGIHLVEAPEEQSILSRIARMNKGGMSFSAIARALQGEGIATKKGGRWHPQTIKNFLREIA